MRVKRKMGPVGEFIFAIVFLVAGCGVIYLMGSDFTLVCHRDRNACTIEETNPFKDKEVITTLQLSDIQKAEVAEWRDSKGKSSYRPVLLVDGTRVPLSDVYNGSYSACSKTANKINAYLQSKEADFSFTQSGKAPAIIGIIFAAVGALLILRFLWKVLKLMLRLIVVVAK